MKNIIITFLSVLMCIAVANAQREKECKPRIELSANGKNPIAVYDLMKDYKSYTNAQYTGKITQIQYDKTNGAEIVGFALELDNGIREAVYVMDDECLSKLTGAERSWLPYLIRKGYRVRVDAEISGSGGFINARNIILLKTPKKSSGKSRKSKKS